MADVIGARFGPYEIAEKIGLGGMGVVYRARDTRLNRNVAIKVIAESYLQSGTPTAASHERFLREARASSALNHPHICTIYDVGEQDGKPYLVMELLQGETLRDAILSRVLSLEQVLEFGLQLTAALVEAHAHGILHRDIKPANLFLARKYNGQTVLKVLDFGLAKHDHPGEGHTWETPGGEKLPALTSTGSAVGTVAYMSPEQARGEALDARSDIFSVGSVLYEMATGRAPFGSESLAEIFAALLTEEPEPVRSFNPSAPRELERILRKALSKDKTQRYQSAQELREDLRELQGRLGSKTLEVVRHSSPERKSGRRRAVPGRHDGRGRVIAGLVLLVLFLAGIATYSWWRSHLALRLTEKDPVIVSEFANRTGDPVFDMTLKEALAIELGQSPMLDILSEQHLRNSLQYLGKPADTEMTAAMAREIGEREGAKAVIAGTIAKLGSEYVLTLEGQNIATGDTFAREQATAKNKEQVLAALHQAATRLRGKLGESLASIQKLSTPFGQATTTSLEAFRAYALGEAEHVKSREAQAIGFYKRAVELDPQFAMAYARLGSSYFSIGSVRQAVANTTKAFELSDHVSERERLYIRSRYYADVLGDLPKTIETLEQYGKTYPADGIVPNNLAVAYMALADYEKAYAAARRAREMEPMRGAVYVNLLAALAGLDRANEARPVFDDAQSHGLADDGSLRGNWLVIAYLRKDQKAIHDVVEWAQGKPDGYIVSHQMAQFADVEGRFDTAESVWQEAISSARERHLQDTAAAYLSDRALNRALAGVCTNAQATIGEALALDRERSTVYASALTLALCGEPARADALIKDLVKRYPDDTLVNTVYAPTVAAVLALGRSRPQEALEALGPAARYEDAGIAIYVRGLAHLALKDGSAAANEFQRVMTRPGVYLAGGTPGMGEAWALAHLGLARAYTVNADKQRARDAYQDFLVLWRDAAKDEKLLLEARREDAAL